MNDNFEDVDCDTLAQIEWLAARGRRSAIAGSSSGTDRDVSGGFVPRRRLILVGSMADQHQVLRDVLIVPAVDEPRPIADLLRGLSDGPHRFEHPNRGEPSREVAVAL